MKILKKINLTYILLIFSTLFLNISLKSNKKTVSFLTQKSKKIEELKGSTIAERKNLHHKIAKSEQIITKDELSDLIKKYITLFDSFKKRIQTDNPFVQKQIIPTESNICIIGDIHGSFKSLMVILKDLFRKKDLNDDFEIKNEKIRIVFTGDYVERGLWGTEVWYTILRLKIANPDKVFLLRGNHETIEQNSIDEMSFFGTNAIIQTFEFELKLKYGKIDGLKLLEQFWTLYNYLPVGLYLGNEYNWVLFTHGGFDPNYDSKKFLENKEQFDLIRNKKISKNFFLWSDFFMNQITKTIEMKIRDSNKKETKITFDSLEKKGIQAIFRGHQHLNFGLKLFNPKYRKPSNWENCVSKNELIYNKIFVAKQYPIFTFSTATECGLTTNPFYGILQTSKKYQSWILIPQKPPALSNNIDNEYLSDENNKFTDEEISKFEKEIDKLMEDIR